MLRPIGGSRLCNVGDSDGSSCFLLGSIEILLIMFFFLLCFFLFLCQRRGKDLWRESLLSFEFAVGALMFFEQLLVRRLIAGGWLQDESRTEVCAVCFYRTAIYVTRLR